MTCGHPAYGWNKKPFAKHTCVTSCVAPDNTVLQVGSDSPMRMMRFSTLTPSIKICIANCGQTITDSKWSLPVAYIATLKSVQCPIQSYHHQHHMTSSSPKRMFSAKPNNFWQNKGRHQILNSMPFTSLNNSTLPSQDIFCYIWHNCQKAIHEYAQKWHGGPLLDIFNRVNLLAIRQGVSILLAVKIHPFPLTQHIRCFSGTDVLYKFMFYSLTYLLTYSAVLPFACLHHRPPWRHVWAIC